MAAQDVDTRAKDEIEADAMNALIDVLGGDDDSNIAKILDAYKIKDPSLIMSLSDDEIGELKITKNQKLSMINGKLLQLFKKCHNCQHCLGKSMKLKDWGKTFTLKDFNEHRVTACAWNTDDGLPHDAARVTPGATICDCHERTFCYAGISSAGP